MPRKPWLQRHGPSSAIGLAGFAYVRDASGGADNEWDKFLTRKEKAGGTGTWFESHVEQRALGFAIFVGWPVLGLVCCPRGDPNHACQLMVGVATAWQ